MTDIHIIKKSITDMEVDVVVNAANSGLRAGSGVCGAIFEAAGRRELQAACNAIGHCNTGDAVITPGFALNAHYVIHAVGPIWEGGNHGEADLLASCYAKSIDLAVANKCASIAFPLISSGIYGYPKEAAWRIAIGACLEKLEQLGEESPSIFFCVLGSTSLELGEHILSELSETK